MKRALTSRFYPDGLGSLVAATDARGVLTESYRYRAFGEPIVLDAQGQSLAASRLGNPFLFTGREFDAETRLYYYRARYYQQAAGRFLSPDVFPATATSPQTWHRYSYVLNNPINRLDPLGLRAEATQPPRDPPEQQHEHRRRRRWKWGWGPVWGQKAG